MDKPQQCALCGGGEIFVATAEVCNRQIGGVNLLPDIAGVWRAGQLEARICGTCGHYRLFVPPETLQKVREKYPRLQ
jgi:hypothetical protein